jgi:hypothetical protein
VSRLRRRREEGQSLVEFSLIVTVLLLLLSGMLEFGLMFDQHMTLETATREGARVGSALVNGGGTLGCGAGQSPNKASVDPQIIAAIQRVLSSPGSRIDPTQISEVKIYKVKLMNGGLVDTTGNQAGADATNANIWVYDDTVTVPVVDGAPLNFRQVGSTGWDACSRFNGAPADSIGVSLTYNYQMVTPLPSVLKFFGGGPSQVTISDRSIMAMNPG